MPIPFLLPESQQDVEKMCHYGVIEPQYMPIQVSKLGEKVKDLTENRFLTPEILHIFVTCGIMLATGKYHRPMQRLQN